MINLHIFRSTFINQSRISREIKAIEELNIFEEIKLIGMGAEGLPSIEKISDRTSIIRLLKRREKQKVIITISQTLIWYLLTIFRCLGKDIKCINCHSINVLPLCVLLKFMFNAKLIYDAHELETETSVMKGFTKYLAKIIEKKLINFCDFSIFVSDSIETWYRNKYSLQNTICIYNCPEKVNIKKSNYLHSKFKINPDKEIFIYQGKFAGTRGIEILLKVFSNKIKSPIVFMGFGPLQNLIKKYSKSYNNIFFHEAVPVNDILKVTASADFGISLVDNSILNHQYCMPNKLFEYIMANLPVLVADTLELKRFVEKNNIGISSKLKIEDIEIAIKNLISNKNEYKKNLQLISKEYNFNNQKSKYLQIFEKIKI